jgi:DNA-binding NarL/FixJ family response regulator
MSIRIALADDHLVVLNGLQAMLAQAPEMVVSGAYTSGADLLAAFESGTTADVLLLDLNLGEEDGVALCGTVKGRFPGTRVLALTSFEQTSMVRAVLQQGASGYLLKNVTYQELLEAIEAVAGGQEYLHAPVREALMAEALQRPVVQGFIPKLTRREKDVLRLIVAERTTQEIADELFVTVNTVETHRANLIQKLGVRNVAGLVKVTLERGLLA